MKKILSVALLSVVLCSPMVLRADEGMWLLSLIGKNYPDMQKAGFKLTVEDIYSINQSCIKDAIVGLGQEGSPFWHFCTGEIISDQGLMSTNHHCGYSYIQKHSTVEHDYLRDGFWAYSKGQELPNPGLTAAILVRIEDVTNRVQRTLSDNMSEADRAKAIKNISNEIIEEATKGTLYDAQVAPLFEGNQFFLFVYIIYKDVRLVGAPPSSMGKFGGDTDNWSWPRHTCDFSMFRIYTAPDGNPAPYSKDNVPLKPKHHLPVGSYPVKDGDFAMIMGFPGTTDRFLTSFGLEYTMDVTNQLRYDIRTVKIDVLREAMDASQAINIKYASKYAGTSNYWKYSIEQNKALVKNKVMDRKKELEQQYLQWAADKAPKYRSSLNLIAEAYENMKSSGEAKTYIVEGLLTGPELPFFAFQQGLGLSDALNEADYDKQQEMLSTIRDEMEEFYKDYDEEVESHLMAALFDYCARHMDLQYFPELLFKANKKYRGDFQRYVKDLMSNSIFTNEESFNRAMSKKLSAKAVENDPLYLLGKNIYEKYREVSGLVPQNMKDNLSRGKRDFVDGILRMKQGTPMAPDANSTIRCTYGNVKSYNPKDGVLYQFSTTATGILEKERPNSWEFTITDKLRKLLQQKDFGAYADADGNLPTCFLTTNDITGGNSGSPVIDGNGNLIGLAFDGNGEAMSGDITFEKTLQRCICLDTRYMLWVIDKYAGAHNLIEELDIVR